MTFPSIHFPILRSSRAFLLVLALLLGACAKTSPKLEQAIVIPQDGIGAQDIFDKTFMRHGGSELSQLNDVNVAIDGEWYYLITKIQPDVTDEEYRQQSEERILLSPRTYSVIYNGEAGTKQVFRSKQNIDVAYNGQQISDERKEAATALTADAFYLFALGPLALDKQVKKWKRLEDGQAESKSYFRINGELNPGIGLSDSDFITLWVDKQSNLTFRMHITLDGFESTQGAHVDTTFLNYKTIDGFTLPVHFFERVLGPIRIDAHEWWYTGLDINRGLMPSDVSIEGWSEAASTPASTFDGREK